MTDPLGVPPGPSWIARPSGVVHDYSLFLFSPRPTGPLLAPVYSLTRWTFSGCIPFSILSLPFCLRFLLDLRSMVSFRHFCSSPTPGAFSRAGHVPGEPLSLVFPNISRPLRINSLSSPCTTLSYSVSSPPSRLPLVLPVPYAPVGLFVVPHFLGLPPSGPDGLRGRPFPRSFNATPCSHSTSPFARPQRPNLC